MIFRVDSSYTSDKLMKFCQSAQNDPHPAARNVELVDWQTRPETLYHQLYIQKIYDGDKNGFYIYEKDDEIICCAGLIHIPEINACVLSRAYADHTVNKFTRVRNYTKFFHQLYDSVIFEKYDSWINFFNTYNLSGRNVITNLNKTPERYKREDKVIEFVNYENPVTYKFTKQFVSYHIINGNDNKVLEYLNGISC